jgi:hypothetical protein
MDKPLFTVINGQSGKTSHTKQKWKLYKSAYDNVIRRLALNQENTDISDTYAKMFFYGTRYITLKYESKKTGIFEKRILNYDELIEDFRFGDLMLETLGYLTLNQLMGIFPLDKEYDGEKYCCKDYFYATKHLKSINPDVLICKQFKDISDFTWIYWNRDIFELDSVLIEIASDIRRCEGQKGIMEEWMEKQGIESYTINSDGIMKNSNGDTICKLKNTNGFRVVENRQC